jgi:hypothetical protein
MTDYWLIAHAYIRLINRMPLNPGRVYWNDVHMFSVLSVTCVLSQHSANSSWTDSPVLRAQWFPISVSYDDE